MAPAAPSAGAGATPGVRRQEVAQLAGMSFAAMWAQHQVQVRRGLTKRVYHPMLGHLEFDCQILYLQDSDQRLVVYTAKPGSPTQEAFRRLGELASRL